MSDDIAVVRALGLALVAELEALHILAAEEGITLPRFFEPAGREPDEA